jgi:hypothetical protein
VVHDAQFIGIKENKSQEKQYAYLVDLTITPGKLVATPFKMWDPHELMPVAADSKTSFKEDPTDGSFGNVVETGVFENGQWQMEDIDKLAGEARIRLEIHLVKPHAVCKLRYYFYDVAKVTLPAVPEAG